MTIRQPYWLLGTLAFAALGLAFMFNARLRTRFREQQSYFIRRRGRPPSRPMPGWYVRSIPYIVGIFCLLCAVAFVVLAVLGAHFLAAKPHP